MRPVLAMLSTALLIMATTTGCSTFEKEWKATAQAPANTDLLAGRWDGSWLSDKNGHNGRLRCIVTKTNEAYRARFHAKYQKVLSFGYTVLMKAQRNGTNTTFEGEADLGWLAGGVYRYVGNADGTNFFSTYDSKYDRGTFRMTRVQ